MLRKAVLGLVCAVAMLGCGASEEEQIADVVRDYNQASIDGDTATAQGHNLGTVRLRKLDGGWKLIDAR